MKVFIVFAHHEPKSFGSALLKRSVEALESQGHEVKVSDLYAMNFNPVTTAADFSNRRFPDILQYDREQKHAALTQTLAPDIRAELDKAFWCDLMILQFPLYWFSVPAIMKGWLDRVFVNGLVQGANKKYDTGGMKGRKAMLTLTTGCYREMMEPNGYLGDKNVILWHLNSGALAYAGFDVLPPYIIWTLRYKSAEYRSKCLDDYAEFMKTIDKAEPIFFHPTADFGSDWRLKPGVVPRTVGQHANIAISPETQFKYK